MRLRLKLLRIIMRNCKPLFFIPIIIAYCLLPGVSAIKYFYVDPSEARSTFYLHGTSVYSLMWTALADGISPCLGRRRRV